MSSDAVKIAKIQQQTQLTHDLVNLVAIAAPVLTVIGGFWLAEYLSEHEHEVKREIVPDPNSPTGNVVKVTMQKGYISDAAMNDIKRIIAGSAFIEVLASGTAKVAGVLKPGGG